MSLTIAMPVTIVAPRLVLKCLALLLHLRPDISRSTVLYGQRL
jgi:hypothetical protein